MCSVQILSWRIVRWKAALGRDRVGEGSPSFLTVTNIIGECSWLYFENCKGCWNISVSDFFWGEANTVLGKSQNPKQPLHFSASFHPLILCFLDCICIWKSILLSYLRKISGHLESVMFIKCRCAFEKLAMDYFTGTKK